MKTFFKVSILVLFIAFTSSILAQKSVNVTSTSISADKSTSKSTLKFAIEAGYINPVRFGSGVSSTYFNGGRLGVTANYDLKNNFSLLTGVLYSVVYSNKNQGYPSSKFVTYKTLGHFLDIPIHATYNLPITNTLKVFAFAGPNINVGLYQKQDINFSDNLIGDEHLAAFNSFSTFTGITPKTIDFYKESVLNRLNLQIGVGGGVQWKHLQLKSGYDFGINNLHKVDTGNLYQKGWYVSFSYEF
ncbi:MAG: outer membrane beta-barrel protein [Paludibacter sp.]